MIRKTNKPANTIKLPRCRSTLVKHFMFGENDLLEILYQSINNKSRWDIQNVILKGVVHNIGLSACAVHF